VSQVTITHDGKGPPIRVQRELREQQQQQQQQTLEVTTQPQQPGGASDSSKRSHKRNKQQQQPSSSSKDYNGRERKQQQQQTQQQQLPQLRRSQPRPHPFYIKPRHVKRHFKVTTADGWKLHLIRLVRRHDMTSASSFCECPVVALW
jgi:hypothetical protein